MPGKSARLKNIAQIFKSPLPVHENGKHAFGVGCVLAAQGQRGVKNMRRAKTKRNLEMQWIRRPKMQGVYAENHGPDGAHMFRKSPRTFQTPIKFYVFRVGCVHTSKGQRGPQKHATSTTQHVGL